MGNSILGVFFLLLLSNPLAAQLDSIASKLSFHTDVRFRVEQDWFGRKSDGLFRDNRTRMRYRVRAGFSYSESWYSFGVQARTGDQRKQQDPQLTLGTGFEEFGTLPIGLEKAFFQAKWRHFQLKLGKFAFPFEKNHEVFWSDNVYPEGVFAGKGFSLETDWLDSLDLRIGHFILSSAGKTLGQDAYVQGAQMYLRGMDGAWEMFPAYYRFRNMPNIPDGAETYRLDYPVFHLGTRFNWRWDAPVRLEVDLYQNVANYARHDSIAANFRDQRRGWVLGFQYGALEQPRDWLFKATYANMQRYSAVDFLAQNDWARWDYSGFNSPDGRLTNFQGMELVAKYQLARRVALTLKCYMVEQLVPLEAFTETGNRWRLDLDVKW
ncbi:putative porin [Pontibacter sp. G13]|uniref:putative porin n=1 Tax=Pontibacter sp. G13 TaxID=3074898 RepID=UPI00288A9D84|nr:putative porin [Pontibacter sp. G13]WNJ19377.1 putative porin [Pontibacter sp. G13]